MEFKPVLCKKKPKNVHYTSTNSSLQKKSMFSGVFKDDFYTSRVIGKVTIYWTDFINNQKLQAQV